MFTDKMMHKIKLENDMSHVFWIWTIVWIFFLLFQWHAWYSLHWWNSSNYDLEYFNSIDAMISMFDNVSYTFFLSSCEFIVCHFGIVETFISMSISRKKIWFWVTFVEIKRQWQVSLSSLTASMNEKKTIY